MELLSFSIVLATTILSTNAVRLNNLFQHIDGYKSDYYLQGWLHIGNNYAVLIRKPAAQDKHITYELYETKNIDDLSESRPQLLAISKIPVEYIKQQLQMYATEVHNAKYLDSNVVPGTKVRTLREWQISKALSQRGETVFKSKPNVLRTRVN